MFSTKKKTENKRTAVGKHSTEFLQERTVSSGSRPILRYTCFSSAARHPILSENRMFIIAHTLLFLAFAQGLSTTDACATRTDGVPCLHVKRCGLPNPAHFGDFKVSDSPSVVAAAQATNGSLCFDDAGLSISLLATDKHIFSPYTACNAQTWVASDSVEVFIAPVRAVTDNPMWYFELDMVPSGVMYGALVNNTRGNATTCIDENLCKASGPLPCSGAADFPHGMTFHVSNATGAWLSTLFLPWGVFAPEFRPAAAGAAPWALWRVNFYRYSYPNPPSPAFDNFELNAWSPTHNPTFHIPARFGVAILQ